MLWKATTTILLNTNIYEISRYSSTYRAMLLDSLKMIQKYQLQTYYLPTVGTVLTAEVVVNFENFFEVILVAN